MTEPLTALSARCFDAERTAMFLDFDGTLVEIANQPDLVHLSPATHEALAKLNSTLGGALAVITGRDIGDVDEFLRPLRLPIAGVHGLKRRRMDGSVHGRFVDDRVISALADRLHGFVDGSEGLLLERKQGSVAIHYRARPDLELGCIAAMDQAVDRLDGIHLVRGKMVIEAKGDASDKGGAVEDFLTEPPFAGRVPFFAGDDATDEDAFAVVNAKLGISVKVGPGKTLARYRANTTLEFIDWLQTMANGLDRE